MHMRRTEPRIVRAGFTLTELMVVIFIILVLISITIGALTKGMEWARSSTTEQTMQKVYLRVEKRLEGIRRDAQSVDIPVQVLLLAGGDQRRARVILTKFMIKWSFPTSYQDLAVSYAESVALLGSNGYVPTTAMLRRLAQQNPSYLTVTNADAMAGGCLALVYESLGGLDDLSGAELTDTDTDNIREIVDGWGTPIRLYRWPTGSFARIQTFFRTVGGDQDDPEGLLYNDAWQIAPLPFGYSGVLGATTSAMEIEARFHPIRQSLGGPRLSRFAPITLASAGPLRAFGLAPLPDPVTSYTPGPGNIQYERMRPDPATAADELDNLYSFRYRLGVRSQ